MSRLIKFQIIVVLLVFALAACSPTTIVSVTGTKPTPVIETVEATVAEATAVPTAAAVELPPLKVSHVQIDKIGRAHV